MTDADASDARATRSARWPMGCAILTVIGLIGGAIGLREELALVSFRLQWNNPPGDRSWTLLDAARRGDRTLHEELRSAAQEAFRPPLREAERAALLPLEPTRRAVIAASLPASSSSGLRGHNRREDLISLPLLRQTAASGELPLRWLVACIAAQSLAAREDLEDAEPLQAQWRALLEALEGDDNEELAAFAAEARERADE